MEHNLKDKSLNARLQAIFRKNHVVLAYFFGSQQDEGRRFTAGKKYRSGCRSDLDIGLLLEKMPKDTYLLYGNLFGALTEVFVPFNIDIVFLNEVHSLLRYEIIKGKRIYARDEVFADDYEEKTIAIAADLAFKRKMFEKDFYEAIRNGYFELELS